MGFRRYFIRKFRNDADGKPVDAWLFGFKVRFVPDDNQTDVKAALCGSCYNFREWRWVAKSLPKGGVFVYIGANMVFFSLFAATCKARIIAIEPNRVLFQRLSANMAFNHIPAHLVNVATGKREGEGFLIQASGDYGGGTLVPGGRVEKTREKVHIMPLSPLLQELSVFSLDVLKINIEEYEDRAVIPFLRQAPDILLPRHMIMEYSERDRWECDLCAEL